MDSYDSLEDSDDPAGTLALGDSGLVGFLSDVICVHSF